MNIESYDGQDAFYTGTDEEYEEFLKNVDVKQIMMPMQSLLKTLKELI